MKLKVLSLSMLLSAFFIGGCGKSDVDKSIDKVQACVQKKDGLKDKSCKIAYKEMENLIAKNNCTDFDLISPHASKTCYKLEKAWSKHIDQVNEEWNKRVWS